tara:strand:- start:496 stop:885 length:390 start_codon:yes stop_codon:yes gene_type:complete
MGYRSEVVLAVSKKMMPHFLGHLSQCDDAAYKFVFMETDKKIEDYDGEGTTVFSWDHIKWYEHYPEVKAINDFVEQRTEFLCQIAIDNDEFKDWGENFRFVRIGEEYEDIEVEGWLCSGDIVINRAVSF